MTKPAKPVTRTVAVNGISLAFNEWRGAAGNLEAPLLIAHATGFHGRCYSAIAEAFPDRRVISLDLRGHGRSTGGPIDSWRTIVEDVSAFLDQLRIRGAVGVGHSMGGLTLAQCAADNGPAFSKLVLFDPVILAPDYYVEGSELFTPDAPHPAIRRKRDFASPQAMMERFAARDPYALFEARVFEDYCQHGLTEDGKGGYVLACSPEMEASVYGSSRSNVGIHDAVASIEIPVLVVRAKQTKLTDFKSSPTWPLLASTMSKGEDMPRPDRTHFHPFEDPADAARIIAEFAAR
ncbi:alpha/beta hydrolase [uncultured Erythrobacter sp.]|uniref:alpha/beta fold hydrolase n=1 Tax=uncultured Erythrobacter sp. TaxID=263913 RepID=UPI002639ABB4|nr:alpha/beta hydrolase [uncultured Erythrobacter sp.]